MTDTGTPEAFMRRAIALSREAMETGKGAPFGAVIVRDGKIIGEGYNTVIPDHDPTAHGEVVAIRDAGRKTGSWDLSGAEIYTSCEPCAMCVAAIHWARIGKVHYAADLTDAEKLGYDVKTLNTLVSLPIGRRAMPAERLGAEEAAAVLVEWSTRPDFAPT